MPERPQGPREALSPNAETESARHRVAQLLDGLASPEKRDAVTTKIVEGIRNGTIPALLYGFIPQRDPGFHGSAWADPRIATELQQLGVLHYTGSGAAADACIVPREMAASTMALLRQTPFAAFKKSLGERLVDEHGRAVIPNLRDSKTTSTLGKPGTPEIQTAFYSTENGDEYAVCLMRSMGVLGGNDARMCFLAGVILLGNKERVQRDLLQKGSSPESVRSVMLSALARDPQGLLEVFRRLAPNNIAPFWDGTSKPADVRPAAVTNPLER